MKCQAIVTVGLLVAVTAFLLTPATAKTPEEPESSVSQGPPSSRSSREIETPPELTFIELSRTKKLSSVRSRPPSRRFRTSSTPLPETQSPTKATPEPQPSTSEVTVVISTTTSPPPVTATQTTPPEGRPNITAKQVRFTKTRAAKSGRGQVFTFTFKNPEDNSGKEKQHIQSRIPARFSPVFTSQAPNRPGSVPQAPLETDQTDNLAIHSGPPGDVPRAGQSGRALNPSVTDGQGNQISRLQDAETNTAPRNFGESSSTDKLVPSLRPKSKTRPYKGAINSLPGGEGTPVFPTQVQQLQLVSEGENSSLPVRRRPLQEDLQRVLPKDAGIPEELPTQPPQESLQSPSSLPAPRIRFVKAGSLRFFPNRLDRPEDLPPQEARNYAEPKAQPLTENEDPSERDHFPQSRRPNSEHRPFQSEPEGFLQDSPANQENSPPGTIRNHVEPTPQISTSNDEQGPPQREFPQIPQQGNQPQKLVPLRLLLKSPVNSQEVPPELARDFANLQNFLASRDPARSSFPALQSPQRPFNPESPRFLSNTPGSSQALVPEVKTEFTDPNLQLLGVNERQVSLKQSDRPTKVTTLRVVPNNSENLEEQARQILRGLSGPDEPTLRVNQGHPERLQEFSQNNRLPDERLAIFVPIGSQRLPFQRGLPGPNLDSLRENEGKDLTRQQGLRANGSFDVEAPRFLPNDPRRLPSQSFYYDGQGLIRQESQGLNQPSNEESLRAVPINPKRIPSLSTNGFVDPNLPILRGNEDQGSTRQESLRADRPPTAGTPRFLLNHPQDLPPQSINYADPNIQNLIENERRILARLRQNRPPLGSVRFISNDQAFSGEQSIPPLRDHPNLNSQNTRGNENSSHLTADSRIHLQRVNSQLDINSQSSPAEHSSQLPFTRELPARSQVNQEAASVNPESNPQQGTARPNDLPVPPPAAESGARVQTAAPKAIPNPGFPINPPTNTPRLIIEFPSSNSGNDQSIRLQLNPNSAPANAAPANAAPAINPQSNIPRAPAVVPSSSAASETSNIQPSQPNGGTTPTAQSILPQVSSLPAPADSLQTLTNQQTSNSALETNSHVNIQHQNTPQSSAISAAGDLTSFQPTQQKPKTPDSPQNILQPSVQSSNFQRGDLPKSQVFQDNAGTLNRNPNTQGITTHSPPGGLGTASKSLQSNSQILTSSSPQPINPLSKTLTFANQFTPLQSIQRDSSNRQQLSLLSPTAPNLAQPLTSSNNARSVEEVTPLTRPTLNSQSSNVGISVNSLDNSPATTSENQAFVVREPPTRLVPISQDLTGTEPAFNISSKSQGHVPESKLSTSDSSSKLNGQVSPVDVRLTINFNANIPGFPSQLQQPPNPGQVASGSPNNTQSSSQEQPPPISLNTNALPIRPELNQQFQPVTATPAKFQSTPSGPAESLTLSSSSPLRQHSNLQIPNNFNPTYNPQFDVRGFSPVTQDSSIRTQPFSQFLNANPGSLSQFHSFGNQFDFRSSQSPTIQEQLARFNQNSQFLPANAAPQISSQFSIPGRPFEVQTQQPSTQSFSARFQPESQYQTAHAGSINDGSINTQFNNFAAQTSQPPFIQTSPTRLRPVPQVFTTNAGLAVNSLSYSPGLSVELLPPLIGDTSNSFKTTELSTTNEQPRVSFLVNSPELSADLLSPVISQSSISAQPLNSQSFQPSSTKPPVTSSPSTSFGPNVQFVPANVGRIPEPPVELLPPLDPFFPQFSQNPNVGLPPNPIDIPKPLVPALVPPPRERITIPIDIPRPAVPALIPPPRERIEIPIDIPRPDVPALVPPPRERIEIPIDIPRPDVPALVPPPRERIEIPIDIPRPDVPALVPPPRERIEIPIDIPRPDVPALVPPPRPSELAASARFLPPAPTSFVFNPPNVPQQENVPNQESRPLNANANIQVQQVVQTNTDNPVLILPKSSSRPQGRSNNPLSIEDLSKKVGFLPQNPPSPFSPSVISSTAPTPTRVQSQTDSVLQITDIRAGRLQSIAQEILPSQPPSSSQTAFSRTPVSLGLQGLVFSTSRTGSEQSVFSNEQTKTAGQSSINERLTSTIQTPTQTLVPPVRQLQPGANTPGINPFQPLSSAFGNSVTSSSVEPAVVNIVPPKSHAESSGEKTLPSQSSQTLPQSSQEGFIIFQTPAITVTSQTNRPDSQINLTINTQGGTGIIKPNTTLTAEPVRPVNQTLIPDQQLFATTPPPLSTSAVLDLPTTLLPPPNQRTSSTPNNNLSPPLDTGFVRNNFTSNTFPSPFGQSPFPLPSSPFRFSNPNVGASPGTSATCPKLDLQHKGHRAPQITGHLILSLGFYPIDEPTPTRCDNRGGIDGKKFNWWQILLNHGGEPSTLSRENESENAKIPALTKPCVRPFETEGVPVFYNATKTDSKTYYREEVAFHRFPGTKNTFLESRGLFVWTQSKSSLDSTAYLVLYTRDDSGFWLQVKSVNCQFNRIVQPNLQCQSVPECFCEGGHKRCTESVPVLTKNFPLKTFRF